MGPAHRRVGSKRSAAKASGYAPWYCLTPKRRDAKKRQPQRTNSKKRRRRADAAAPVTRTFRSAIPRALGAAVALLVLYVVGIAAGILVLAAGVIWVGRRRGAARVKAAGTAQ